MKKFFALIAVILTFSLNAGEKALAVATIPPLQSLAAAVAGDTARAVSLLAPGKSPHDYAFTPADIATLAQAKVWLTIGLPLETPLRERLQAGHPQLLIADTIHGIKLLPMDAAHHHAHAEEGHHHDAHAEEEHGHHHDAHTEEEHGHHHHDADGMDPHVWLDPLRAVTIAENIRDAFSKAWPENRETYARNTAKLVADLRELDKELQTALAPEKGKKIIVFHPAFGYFCGRYGLTQLPIELDGRAPSAAWLGQVIRTAKAENIKVVFVQPQFNTAAAQTAARAINGTVAEFDALPADYPGYLRQLAGRLRTPEK